MSGSSEVKNGGAIPPLSHTSLRYGADVTTGTDLLYFTRPCKIIHNEGVTWCANPLLSFSVYGFLSVVRSSTYKEARWKYQCMTFSILSVSYDHILPVCVSVVVS
jgi:hypothetical protein